MYCVCEEHMDRAVDEFVEVYDAAPDIYVLQNLSFSDWEAPATCEFCECRPVYLVV